MILSNRRLVGYPLTQRVRASCASRRQTVKKLRLPARTLEAYISAFEHSATR